MNLTPIPVLHSRHSKGRAANTGVYVGFGVYYIRTANGTVIYRPTEIEAFLRLKYDAVFGWGAYDRDFEYTVAYTPVSDVVLDAFLFEAGVDGFHIEEITDIHAVRVQELAEMTLDNRGRGLGVDPQTGKTKKTYSPERIADFANWHAKHDFVVTADMVREAQSRFSKN